MAEAETPSPLPRCVHKCLNPSSSPPELGGSVGAKLRRSSKEHAGDDWLSAEQSALHHEQHEEPILNLTGTSTAILPDVGAEGGAKEHVLSSSPESGDDAARRVYICMDPCTFGGNYSCPYFTDTSVLLTGSTPSSSVLPRQAKRRQAGGRAEGRGAGVSGRRARFARARGQGRPP